MKIFNHLASGTARQSQCDAKKEVFILLMKILISATRTISCLLHQNACTLTFQTLQSVVSK